MSMRGCLWDLASWGLGLLAGSALVVVLLLAWLLLWPREHARLSSPDGRFEAIAWTRPIQGLLPGMPGGGSDQPGWVEILRKEDGRSCGTAPLTSVWMLGDLRWSEAEAELVGQDRLDSWDLESCRVMPR
jgi:hypothetical protein